MDVKKKNIVRGGGLRKKKQNWRQRWRELASFAKVFRERRKSLKQVFRKTRHEESGSFSAPVDGWDVGRKVVESKNWASHHGKRKLCRMLEETPPPMRPEFFLGSM